jgi:enterochelin esterase-like enzyme
VAVVNPQSLGTITARRPAASLLAGLAAEASSSAGITRVIPYQGKAKGPLRTAWLYTPPQFRADRTYPVMYLLHRGTIEAQWMLLGGAGHALDRLIGQRAIRPVVVAMPIEQDVMAPLNAGTPSADGRGPAQTAHSGPVRRLHAVHPETVPSGPGRR